MAGVMASAMRSRGLDWIGTLTFVAVLISIVKLGESYRSMALHIALLASVAMTHSFAVVSIREKETSQHVTALQVACLLTIGAAAMQLVALVTNPPVSYLAWAAEGLLFLTAVWIVLNERL